jgi:hypothetical protein
MIDPTMVPDQDLPTPADSWERDITRDFPEQRDMSDEEPEEMPAMPEPPAEPQEPSEATQERPVASASPAKLGITAVRALDERVDVMIARIHSFRMLLAKHGVDLTTNSPSLIKRELVQALASMELAEQYLVRAKQHTNQAFTTLDSL